MKLATWNVNSIRAREERLVRWLGAHQPDVLCLQELKVTDDAFPLLPLQALGYHAAVHGQKTYNGVAVLSRVEPLAVERGFGDGGDDTQSRIVTALIGNVHVVSAYVPNGQEVGSEKWAYKMEWMKRLRAWLDRRFAKSDLVALCGDFNVAPEARDVHDPARWETSVLFHPEARAALEHVRAWGLVDASACTTRSRASTRGGTTGCSPSRRRRACASITSSSASRSPRSAPPPSSTARSGRASSPPTTRRCVVELEV